MTREKCRPYRKDELPLTGTAAGELLAQLAGWQLADSRLMKNYTFKNFAAALAFVNRIGALGAREAHHPDICFGWGKAEITLTTHSLGGLSRNDFIVAAKIDADESAQS